MTPCTWGASFAFNSGASFMEFDAEIVGVISPKKHMCLGLHPQKN